MTPTEAASIAAVAGQIRQKILDGAYPDGRVESRVELARLFGLSPESAGIVLRRLRDEGLVTLQQGRGTYVSVLHTYEVLVTVDGPERASVPDIEWRRHQRLVADARKSRSAVDGLALTAEGTRWTWRMVVRSADPGHAAVTGLAAADAASRPGWYFPLASVSVTPL